MAQKFLKTDRCSNGYSGLQANDAINDNFTELYGQSGSGGSTPSTGTVISFDVQRTYGIPDAEDGNITADLTDAVSGVVQLIRHEAATEPTFGAEFIKLASYSYTENELNYIYLEYVSDTEILVTASIALA